MLDLLTLPFGVVQWIIRALPHVDLLSARLTRALLLTSATEVAFHIVRVAITRSSLLALNSIRPTHHLSVCKLLGYVGLPPQTAWDTYGNLVGFLI